MRRADRLLQIVQILRRNRRSTTAAEIASELEVSIRTVYRDVATLQSTRVPIDGEAGVGYVLRPGYDLPPLMFSADELDAIVLGARMAMDRGDPRLALAARDVIAKVAAVLPDGDRRQFEKGPGLVPHPVSTDVDFGPYLSLIRQASRTSTKLLLVYEDSAGTRSSRTVWPLGMYLYSHVTLVCAWCEVRRDYRAFRSDRIVSCVALQETFDGQGGRLFDEFLSRHDQRAGTAA